MDKETLEAKREALQAAFDTQTKIKSDAEAEQLRLQGQYRMLTELIDNLEEPTPEGVIDGEEVKIKKKGK